ncbi:MAG: SRPBCC family protein, partial [Beijerinckiaceae bacterium]|nr:SRPBCC family protein [Beijerinckiaceae bacterium]
MAGKIQKLLFALIALSALALPQAVWPHGPTRQKVTESILIDAPPAKVWAAIADFHDL